MATKTLFAGSLLAVIASSTTTSPAGTLWYTSPAQNSSYALPIGNGRLGATIYGKVENETWSMNEDSIWSGGFTNRLNPNAKEAFPRIRSKMDAGNLTDAGNDWLQNMTGVPQSPRFYQPAGNIVIYTGHDEQKVSAYNRGLDLSTSTQYSTYMYENVTFERRAIASAPDNVIAFHFNSTQPGSIALNVSMERASGLVSTRYDDGQVTIRGAGTDDETYTFTMAVRVISTGGNISSNNDQISVTDADSVTIFWDAEGIFRYPEEESSYEEVLFSRLDHAASQGFDAVLDNAINDYKELYSRVSLDLGSSGEAGLQPTSQRLRNFAAMPDIDSDPDLLNLMYNFGRYLMISSARPGTLPPNLQGIWNDNYNPPWGSKYTIDINLQMNYWMAEPNDLSELTSPLWDLLGRMQTHGKEVAAGMYSAPGWVCHHNTDMWGDCMPVDSGTQWTIWPMGGAWLMSHVFEHYRFTGDKAFVRDVALPLVSDAIRFYSNFSVLRDGHRTNYPSNSPENSYVIPAGDMTAGQETGIDTTTQMDRALLWDLFSGFIELSGVVGSTEGVDDAKLFLSQLEGPTISPSSGRLLEWSQDFNETEPGHRHFSPLAGLHPLAQYSPLNNATIAKAAYNLLQHRMDSGSGSTGWSRIWSSSLYARSFQGDEALNSCVVLLTDYVFPNLQSITSDVYQIDANFGIVAALNEMFLQSQTDGIVHLGPAMPTSKLASGSFRGWKARGGLTVSAAWDDHHIVNATIGAAFDGPLKVRVEGGRSFKINGRDCDGTVQATVGMIYLISF